MAKHELKSWPWFFKAIVAGDKTHDLRDTKDREFAIGDTLLLREFDPVSGDYTGAEQNATVTFITSTRTPCAYSSAVLAKDYCILSIRKVDE